MLFDGGVASLGLGVIAPVRLMVDARDRVDAPSDSSAILLPN